MLSKYQFLGLLSLFSIVYSTLAEVLSRAPNPKSHILCCRDMNHNWYCTCSRYIKVGIVSLKAIGGPYTVAAGPEECIDLIFDDEHRIDLCNDNHYPITPNCDYSATYAEGILGAYNIGEGRFEDPYSCGKQFDTDNYSMIARGNTDPDSCTGRKA